MKTPTTKPQRKKIYRAAALYFFKSKYNATGFCNYLFIKHRELQWEIDSFPEYLLFENNYCNYYYFTTVTQTDRINALLLAAEMCN